MPWDPDQVVFGIRHKRLFGFLGRAGDILDAINALNGAPPFREGFFTKVSWPNRVTDRIEDQEETFFVDVNIDGIVVTVKLEESGFSHQQAKTMFARIARDVLPISEGDTTVNRVGIVNRYTLKHNTPAALA